MTQARSVREVLYSLTKWLRPIPASSDVPAWIYLIFRIAIHPESCMQATKARL